MNKVPLTISALNKYLKYCFDHDVNLQNVYIKGEISNFKHHNKGHFYFTLKDETSQISAIMFSKNASAIDFKIEDGMKVIVSGYVTLYVQGGSYQLYVNSIHIDGLGELYLRFEQLKEKLLKQGLFDDAHKLPIPKLPKKIAVITSPTGAAIRDIITTIERRYPLVHLEIFPTLVQGENAKYSIVESLKKANLSSDIDCIILGRGGGSIEDLWCFNEEIVALAIYESRIPIISAVGHETDFTIADFVSDLRAATPTAAAELAVPNKQDLILYLMNQKKRIASIYIERNHRYLDSLSRLSKSYVFRNPERLFEQNYLKIDKLYTLLEKNNPYQQFEHKKQKLNALHDKLNFVYSRTFHKKNNQFIHLGSKLELVNPLSILQKGYSLVKKETTPILSIQDVSINDEIDIYLKDGVINCWVKNKEVKKYD